MITIIDYKSGNLKSISNGFKKIARRLLPKAIIWFFRVLEHSGVQWRI